MHRLALGLAVLLAAASPRSAAGLELAGTLGAALQLGPAGPGAAAYRLQPRPTGRLAVAQRGHLDLRDRPRAAWDVRRPGPWRLAVAATAAPGRPRHFARRYDALESRGPRPALGIAAERRRGPLAVYVRGYGRWGGGVLGALGGEVQTRLGLTPWVLGLEGRLDLASRPALAPRWRVGDAAAEAHDGLSAHRPDGGLAAARGRATAVRLLGPGWAWAARASLARLGPAAAASPLAEHAWHGRLNVAVLRRF